MLAMPQLSLADAEPSVTLVALHWPTLALTVTVAGQLIVGGVLSRTTTKAVQLLELPQTSVTLNTTEFVPMFPQPKREWFIDRVSDPAQLSKLPPSTCVAVIITSPFVSRFTVILVQIAVGGVVSFTVMV